MEYMGLRWYMCDFHLHSMASQCYKERDNDTIDMWVEEVKRKGIQCVAITDHNDYRGIDGIKEKCREEGIIAFPGVELSCDSSKVHLLIIFDVVETGEKVQEFLNQVGIFRESLGNSGTTCRGDIFEVCNKAHDMGALILAAHIDEFNGVCEISHDNIVKVLNREYIDAVQIVNEEIWIEYEKTGNLTEISKILEAKYGKTISEDKIKNWYKTYQLAMKSGLPMLNFSDNPHGEKESSHGLWGIGKSYTWLKMKQIPDLESVRQALLSFDMRVKKCTECASQPDMVPELWIRAISFENTILNEGKEIYVNFNPQLNTIIGGRGSGKSSIIRMLAGGMDSFDADELEAIRNEQESFYQERKKDKNGVYKGIFKNDSILNIYIERAGDSYKIEICNVKKMQEQERTLYKLISGVWTKVDDSNYLDFFKAQIYTQKQIYEIALDSNSLLSIIDEDIDELSQMIAERDAALDSVIAKYLEINTLKKSVNEESMINSELADLEDQIKKFEKSGISVALKEKQKFDTQKKIIEDYLAKKSIQIEAVEQAVCALLEEGLQCPEIDNEEVRTLIETDIVAYTEKMNSLLASISLMKKDTEEFEEGLKKSQWNAQKDCAESEYAKVLRNLQAQGTSFDKLDDLLEKKKAKLRELDKIKSDKKKLDMSEEERAQLYQSYEECVKRITNLRSEFIHSVIGNDANVKFAIQRGRNINSFVQMMKSVLGKENATIDEGINQMAELFFDNGGIAKFREQVCKIREGIDKSSYSARMRNAIIDAQPESFARMITFVPEDDLRVSYKPENSKKYIPLSNASAGQKTTAILTFLLAYGELPLLLDQPEDDLDNKLVYDLIVTRLKKAKSKRQIIVVTHNANIPVNADAEYIVSMDSETESVAVKYEGTMDDTDIRKEICDVMEGTQYAFEMRAKKYHFRIVE